METDNKDVTAAAEAVTGGKTAKAKKAAAQAAVKTATTAPAVGADPATTPEDPGAADPKGTDPSPEQAATAAKKKEDPFAKLAKEYSRRYPKNPLFHITSDGQVFLDKDKRMAELHQRSLGNGGKVTSVKA